MNILLRKARSLLIRIRRYDVFWKLQRRIRKVELRNRIANMIAKRRPSVGNESFRNGEENRIQELHQDGLTMLGKVLEMSQIAEILAFLRDRTCSDGTKEFPLDQAPSSCHIANYSPETILQCPYLLKIANDDRVLRIASAMLGCKPTISNLSLWWSLPGHDTPEKAQLFHRDVDDWRFVKLFVYLTDVDAATGPHVYVKGSHCRNALLQVGRYPDETVAQEFGANNILTITGPAGYAFLGNTFGVHKGLLPQSARRLLFQVQYSLSPIRVYEYNPVTLKSSNNIDRYVNRLYVRHDA